MYIRALWVVWVVVVLLLLDGWVGGSSVVVLMMVVGWLGEGGEGRKFLLNPSMGPACAAAPPCTVSPQEACNAPTASLHPNQLAEARRTDLVGRQNQLVKIRTAW
jgi:hypothetical protein